MATAFHSLSESLDCRCSAARTARTHGSRTHRLVTQESAISASLMDTACWRSAASGHANKSASMLSAAAA
eukprot:scaffold90234_cov32-Tisochrysis_lutea.AAC.2